MVTTEASYKRLVQRAFEKIRQSGKGMPAVMIRQLDALAKIMERATAAKDRQLLLDQGDRPGHRRALRRTHLPH